MEREKVEIERDNPLYFDGNQKKARMILVLALSLMVVLLGGCASADQSGPTESVMAKYCSNESVDNFYRQNSKTAEELTEAWKKRDEKSFEKARKELIKVCDDFIAVNDVPVEVEEMHDHMVSVATKEKEYAYLLSIDDYEKAGKVLDDISQEVKKAEAVLPQG